MRAAAMSLLLLVVVGPAAAAGPTDIPRVDEIIDAPPGLLAWPGLDVAVSRSSRVAAVVLRAAGRPLPHGLDVGTPRARVEAVLGEAQDATDERYAYVDADGFPNSVEFFFRAGRVTRIEWRFWAD